MSLDALKYMHDIIESLDILESFKKEITSISAIKMNQMLNDAIQRRLGIIGEALYKANKYEQILPITDKQKIMGLRHILVHDYDKVREDTLYIIVTKHLELLRQEVEAIIKANPPQGSMNLDD